MLELVEPTRRLMAQWQEAHAEWGPGNHEDGFGLLPTDESATSEGFMQWLTRLNTESDHCSFWWMVEDGRVLGGIALRHASHPQVERLGHVGYGVRPSARRRGVASWALNQVVAQAHALGIDELLIICEAGNLASAATVEKLPSAVREHRQALLEEVIRYRVRSTRGC